MTTVRPASRSPQIIRGQGPGDTLGASTARVSDSPPEHGTGLGGDLLKDALARCAAAAADIGGRAVLVHAKDNAAATFYRRYGFQPLPQNPSHLHMLMKNVEASIRRSLE